VSWELGSRPGVVDALDAQQRPMPVPLPTMAGADLFIDSEFTAAPRLTFHPLIDDTRGWWFPVALIGIGFIAGMACSVLLMWWRR
jgi:hypothetical protein